MHEACALLGGMARTRSVDGYALNLGPHAIYPGVDMTSALVDLGVSYGPEGIRVLHEGAFAKMPDSPAALVRSKALTWKDRFEFVGMMSKLPKPHADEYGRTSIASWIDANTRRLNLRGPITSLAHTDAYCSDLALVGADVFIDEMQRLLNNHVRKASHRLVESRSMLSARQSYSFRVAARETWSARLPTKKRTHLDMGDIDMEGTLGPEPRCHTVGRCASIYVTLRANRLRTEGAQE